MKKLNVKTVVFAGVLIAMNIILTRILAINLGPTLRITMSATPIYLASLWFGPVVGGICGGVGDILGCFVSGYAPNPYILVTSVLAGVIPAIMKKYIFHGKMNPWKIAIAVVLHGLIGSMGFTSLGLHIFYGTPWVVLLPSRAAQTVGLVIANSILVSILYQSVLTSFVQQSMHDRRRQSRTPSSASDQSIHDRR